NILSAVRKIYELICEKDSFSQIESAFHLICSLFNGNFPGYRKCRTEYHDIYHTLDAFLAAARLIDGRLAADLPFSCSRVRLTLIAALLHDTGYIQEDSDCSGTGAQYTKTHVARSSDFVRKNAKAFSLSDSDAEYISAVIACTDLGFDMDSYAGFLNEDLVAGQILGTADILGQMSDRTYLEKLLFLYYEFREGGVMGFESEFDLLRKTHLFYRQTMKRLDITLGQTYRYAAEHFRARFDIHKNLYIEAIERQMDYLNAIIEDEQTNFRKKLKRLDIETLENRYLNLQS
ncbi:MAG: HD domain-containing protein, partial [Spirochaetota bacterium]